MTSIENNSRPPDDGIQYSTIELKSLNNACSVQTSNRKTLATPKVVQVSSCGQKKQYFCIYCKTKVTRFARHLQIKHRFEPNVTEFIKLPAGDATRNSILNELRSAGTFMYNTHCEYNGGDVIVARRPQISKNRTAMDYTPCPKCKNFFKKNLLYRHYKRCGNTTSRSVSKTVPRTLQAHSRATLYEGTIDCYKLKKYRVWYDTR